MAELILSEEEREASYLMDWDDETIAKVVRYLEKNFWTSKEGDTSSFSNTTAGLILISTMLALKATELDLELKKVTIKGEPQGDFQIKIRQVHGTEKSASLKEDMEAQNQRQLEFAIAGNISSWSNRFLTAWHMVRAAASTLCAGKFSLLVRKEYMVNQITQSGHNI